MRERKITPVHYGTLIRIFELDGFAVKRKKGDRIIMTKAGIKRPLVIKSSPGSVPVTPYSYKYANRWDVERALL